LGLNLNLNLERIMVMLVIVSFAFTSVNLLSAQGSPITREEAIEISKNTPIVQEALSYVGMSSRVTADHWNATYIILLKQEHPNLREIENLPEDHSVWRIFWVIFPPGYHILHYIDDLTGEVLHEGVLYAG
jgi:hypothetical protein